MEARFVNFLIVLKPSSNFAAAQVCEGNNGGPVLKVGEAAD
jgi:hypothetical protein